MEILLVDPLSPIGHKDVNEVMIKILNESHSLTYVSCEGYPSFSATQNIKDYYGITKSLFKGTKSIQKRINYFRILNLVFKIISKKKFDQIIFLSYDTVTFSIYSYINSRKMMKFGNKIHLLNHTNIDEISRSKLKHFLFELIPNNINHICYEDFISTYMTQKLKKKASTVRHNLNEYKLNLVQSESENITSFFEDGGIKISAISGNCISEKVMNSIIELDNSNVLNDLGIKFFIKNKKIKFKSDNILIFDGYLNDVEFNYILDKSDYIFLPYNDSEFDLRISGIFFDAVTFCKPVITSNTKFFRHVLNKFGELGFLYKSDSDLIDIISNFDNRKIDLFKKNIFEVRNYYSNINIMKDLDAMFKVNDIKNR